ncbi:hypothetical protein B484DRAFT_310265, partial [Ochromonadaceae sp. CCMP2298]
TARHVGQVKWFNNKAGFGFITMIDGMGKEWDIFTHFSTLVLAHHNGYDQYKYLVQGEYVEFEISPTNNKGHEFQAMYVTGINSGPLMCETREKSR